MKQGCILGAGPAGLIAGYYFPEYTIYDENPLGQLNLPFIPGPRLLQKTSWFEKFIRSVLDDAGLHSYRIKTVVASVGYEDDGERYPKPPPGFKSKYTKLTRGKGKSEASYLSEGKNEIQHLEIEDMGEDSYKFLFKTLLQLIEGRGQLIKEKVTCIEPGGYVFPGQPKFYTTIINTLNLKLLAKIWEGDHLDNYDLTTLPKCFYQTNKGEYSKYDYIYGHSEGWSRKTYFKDYMVYESVDPIAPPYPTINKFEGLPIQIQNSIDIDKIGNVVMLGRFAQWNHKIKANEVLERVLKLKMK